MAKAEVFSLSIVTYEDIETLIEFSVIKFIRKDGELCH